MSRNILVEDDRIEIKNFETDDPDIISYFGNIKNPEDLNKKLEELLKIGVIAMKSVNISGSINYVDKAFENLDMKFRKEIDKVFESDGKFSELLKEHFGEDGEIVKKIFDPNKEGSPLYILKSDLNSNILEIRDKIEERKGFEKEHEKGTQKGIDFEIECLEKLQYIAKIHSDEVELTGRETAGAGRSKKGDIVVKLNDIKKKIVFEMKDRKTLSLPEIKRELEEAIKNREADYGILIAKSEKSLPGEVGCFNEYNGNYLICATENEDGESLINGQVIQIAYKWAKSRLTSESDKQKNIDPAFITRKVNEIGERLKDMRKIKKECTVIVKSSKFIQEESKNIEDKIKEDIDEIIESLKLE